MRIIDYIIVQIVSLIKEPESLTMNAELLEIKKNNLKSSSLKARRVWGDLDFILKKFICPTFVDFRATLRHPLLQIKGWWQFDQYFQVDASTIDIFNAQREDQSRLLRKGGTKLISG
jgi:vacuolar protein sorting-associated protein 13A/C